MAGTRITFTFEGDVQLDRTITRVHDAVTDGRPVWEKLAVRFARLERRQFASQGAYASGGWEALSPDYAARKARTHPGKGILVRTGALRDSLTRRPFGIEIISPRFAAFGSGVPYAKYHQRGGAGLPQRRPVELPEAERRAWVKSIQRFVITGKV